MTLYAYAYARPDALKEGVRACAARCAGTSMAMLDPAFSARIAAACTTEPRWDPGWTIYQMDADGSIHVRKGDRYRVAKPGSFQADDPSGALPRIGRMVMLPVRRDDDQRQPGFHYLLSEALPSEYDHTDLVRVYFNPHPEGVPALVRAVTAALNRYEVPFAMKVLANPRAYDRADAGVLYFGKRFSQIAMRLLADLLDSPDAGSFRLRSPVPLFTRRMVDGVGLAEDPATGESFGQSRCRLLAQGLLDAWQAGSSSLDDRFAAVSRRFAAEGLSLAAPHLRPDSVDRFDWTARTGAKEAARHATV